jgi:hypothetical protein
VSVRRPAILLLTAALLQACGRSPEKQAQEAATELRSWSATLELLSRERARGSLSERFAEQVSRAAAEGRAGAEARLREARAQ